MRIVVGEMPKHADEGLMLRFENINFLVFMKP